MNWTALLIALGSAIGAGAAHVALRALRQEVQALSESSHGHQPSPLTGEPEVAGRPVVPGAPGDVVTSTVTPVRE